MAIPNFLEPEIERNKASADFFTRLMQRAYGDDIDVLVGHHLTFMRHGRIETEDEVPSADTALTNHDLMKRVFGDNAIAIMQKMVTIADPHERDRFVERELDQVELDLWKPAAA